MLVVPAALWRYPAAAEGLQDTWLASARWNALFAGHTALVNPAILTKSNFISIRASLSSIPRESYAHELGVIIPVGLRQSAGIGWMMDAFTSDKSFASGGGNLEDKASLVLLSYAVNPWRPLSIGINITMANQAYSYTRRTYGFGGDAGIMYEILRHPRAGAHTLGVCAQNAVLPDLGRAEKLLRALQLSAWSVFFEEALETRFDLSLRNPLGINAGSSALETREPWDFSACVTYRTPAEIHFHVLCGVCPSGVQHIGLAAGFEIPAYINDKQRDALSVAYQHCWLVPDETSAISVYFRTEAGKHRLTADILLAQATALYNQENFEEAFFAFGRVIAEYPYYEKNDVASFFMAQCALHLDMNAAAQARFSTMLDQYPASAMRDGTILGIMTAAYRRGDSAAVGECFGRLMREGASDSLKLHGMYLMAQTYMRRLDYANALPLLSQIPPGHPEYFFGRYSLAVAFNALGHADSAIQTIEDCLLFKPSTLIEQEIINRSRILLGYLYFEHAGAISGALDKGTRALRMVSKDCGWFGDALLGLGWLSLKAGQYKDCIIAADELAKSDSRSLRAEGLLLKGYAFYAQEHYEKAVAALEEAERALGEGTALPEDTPGVSAASYAAFRGAYDSIGFRAEELALSRRTRAVRREITAISEKMARTSRAIQNLQKSIDNAARESLYDKNAPKLKDDIQYALASASYLLRDKERRETFKPTRRLQSIERKIEKYREEIEELENK